MGCYHPNPDGTYDVNRGITFTATAQIPSGNYLSDPADSGIIFKQFTSEFSKRIVDVDGLGFYAFGQVECDTRRTSEADVNSGWELDGQEAYGHPYIRPAPRFSLGNVVSYQTFDAPAQALDETTSSNWTNVPAMRDAYYSNAAFEMYVYYFVGRDPNAPIFQRPLRLASNTATLYDRIVWRSGGQAYYDSAVPDTRYRLQFSTTSQGTINATGTNFVVPSRGVSQTLWGPCPGGPISSNNKIDGTRFFVRQLSRDIFKRDPRPDEWDFWTSVITRCAFDQNCIHSKRIQTARGYLESLSNPEFFKNPLLKNPGTHEYNREYVRLCYSGFLIKTPDQPGWDFWTNHLDTHPGDYETVIAGFIDSVDYRTRKWPKL